MELIYDYIDDGDKQYPDLKSGTAVEARYRHCYGDEAGNPLLEALPPYYVTEEEIIAPYSCNVFRSRDELYDGKVPIGARLNQVLKLDKLRIPPNYALQLDGAVGQALVTSYSRRFEHIVAADGSVKVSNMLMKKVFDYGDCNEGDLGMLGIKLMGPTGCGKTCAKKMVLAKYPSLIVHHFEGIGTYHQVVYLNAECPANADLSTLFNTFAENLDKTLGNTTPWFGPLMKKVKGTQAKASYLCTLIKDFSIGALIIDECEHLDLSAHRRISYDALITIINQTRVAVILVGQSEVVENITELAQVDRRFGKTVNAGKYCHNYNYFKLLLSEFTKYNWKTDEHGRIEPPVVLSEQECLALYAVCSGSVSMLMKVWILIQQYGIQTGKWSKLTYDFVSGLLGNTSPGLEDKIRISILSDHLNKDNHNPLMVAAISRERLINLPKSIWTLKAMATPITDSTHALTAPASESVSIVDEVVRIVSEFNESNGRKWTDETIHDMVVRVCALKYMQSATADQLADKCIEKLKPKSDRRIVKATGKPKTKHGQNEALVAIGDEILKKSMEQEERLSG